MKAASDSEVRTVVDSQISLPGWPHFGEEEISVAVQTLNSGKVNYWTGREGRQFEKEFAETSGCAFGVALSNGTVALELALRVLGIGPGHEVITTSRTFIASASCAVSVGATPIFADVDPDSQNVTAQTLRAAFTSRTRAIVVVHLAGWPCDMDQILEFARQQDIYVIEDCAQAHGAQYKGRPVGSMGSVGAFSFCQDKILTTGGEGGMLVTNDEALFKAAWSYKDHGKSYDVVHSKSHSAGFRWLHNSFGSNWRMTEFQAAIGRVQLRNLEAWVETRRRNAAVLQETFEKIPALRTPLPGPGIYHSYYKCYTFLRPEHLRAGWTRDRIMGMINELGVPCFSGSCSEVYLEGAFSKELRPIRRMPVASELGETSLMFQVHPTLTVKNMRDVTRVVEEVMAMASV